MSSLLRRWGSVIAMIGLTSCGPPDPFAAAPGLRETIAAIASEDVDVSDAAAERLRTLGALAVPAVVAAMPAAAMPHQLALVEWLAELSDPAARDALLGLVDVEDPQVRAAVVTYLGRVDHPRVPALLETALDDPSPVVQLSAAAACGARCRSPHGLERLVDLALYPPIERESARARHALRQLVQGAATADFARTAIEAKARPLLARASGIDERALAAILLAEVGMAFEVPVLLATVRESRDLGLRLHALHHLRDHGDAASLDVLTAALAEPPLQMYAFDALRGLEARAVPGAADSLAGYRGVRPPGRLPRPNL